MQRTRRQVIAFGSAAGLAGCLGVGGVEYPDADPEPAEPDDDTADESDDDPDDEEQVDDPAVPDNEVLATATRRVVDDAVWFATEYPDAVETYRNAIGALVSEIDAVRSTVESDGVATDAMVDQLDDAGRTAADRAAAALEPHFRVHSRIVSRTERHVDGLRRFAPRDDVDRFLEELNRMRREFDAVGTDLYIRETFSRKPIHNRLLNRLLYPLPDDLERRREIRGTALIEVAVASRGFSTFAREPYDHDRYDRSRIPRIYGNAFGSDRREELRARLGPISSPTDRTEELFFVFATRPPAGNRPSETVEGWAYELNGTPVHVQRYADIQTARERFESILANGSTEGTAPIDPAATAAGSDFSGDSDDSDESAADGNGDEGNGNGDDVGGDAEQGPTRWHRFYHHEASGERYGFDEHAGVQYGYVTQAGEFVLATGFSGDAWEERAGWQRRLADGWAIQ